MGIKPSSVLTFTVDAMSTPLILDYTYSRSLSTTPLPKSSPQEDAGCEDFLFAEEDVQNAEDDELRRGFETLPKILKTRGFVGAMHALCPLLCKARHEYQKKCRTSLEFSPENVNELFYQLLRGCDTRFAEFIVACSESQYSVQSV
jgi:hypothetical protein